MRSFRIIPDLPPRTAGLGLVSLPHLIVTFPPSLRTPTARVALALATAAALLLSFVAVSDRPWEGHALQRVARGMDLAEEAVPRSVFHDFETLGSLNLGTAAYQQIGLWWGGLAVGLVLAAAAVTTRWWLPLILNLSGHETSPPAFPARRLDWLGLALALLLATWLRAPHLDRSLYFDEQDNLRRNFHGHLEIRPDGEESWRGAGWREALFENRLGNNPVFLSVACQASLRLWRAVSGAERERFDIVALRMPVFLAGLGSIAALWWLLQLWGLRAAAAIAALLAAVHPMHIDYSLQARGYAFVLLFVPLALGFAWRAVRRDRWRDWLAMAFCVFFCLWSYAGSVYFALALNAGLLVWLVVRRLRHRDPALTGSVARLLAVNALTGLLYLFLIAPHLPQVSYHFRNIFELIPLQPYWIFYAWSHYSTGTNFPGPGDIHDLRTGAASLSEVLLQRFAGGEPILVTLQWLIIPALILTGVLGLRGRETTAVASSPSPRLPAWLSLSLALAAPVIALAHQQFTSLYFYYWYLSYALPAVIAGVAIGLQMLASRARRPVGVGIVAAFFALFLWQVTPGAGKPNRLVADTPWPTNDEGESAVEFRRGQTHWIATRDGRSISQKDAYEDDGERTRAGR